MIEPLRAAAMLTIAALSACGSAAAPEPSDVDLGPARAGFHCGPGATGDDATACGLLDAFGAAGPLRAWPAGDEVQAWLGVDHCVQPTATSDYAVYQLVYLRAGAGSGPASTVPPARVLPYSGVFGSSQVNLAQGPELAAALGALARGQVPEGPAELWRDSFPNGEGAYTTLVRSTSGTTVGNGTIDTGVWFLRSDGTHLLLVGPTIQGGCVSELYRVPL